MIERRTFLALASGSLLAAPFAADAQRASKVHRIGVLWYGPRDPRFEGFIHTLAELGFMEGRNLFVEFRTIILPQLSAQAADLVRLTPRLLRSEWSS